MRAPTALLLLLACCTDPRNVAREGTEEDPRVESLERRLETLEGRLSGLDDCLMRKLPGLDSDFQTRMALLTCVTVAR
jgi:hypothetical protein